MNIYTFVQFVDFNKTIIKKIAVIRILRGQKADLPWIMAYFYHTMG